MGNPPPVRLGEGPDDAEVKPVSLSSDSHPASA
jgi:hypothetical protein